MKEGKRFRAIQRKGEGYMFITQDEEYCILSEKTHNGRGSTTETTLKFNLKVNSSQGQKTNQKKKSSNRRFRSIQAGAQQVNNGHWATTSSQAGGMESL